MVALADEEKHIFHQYNKQLVKYQNKDVNIDYTHTVSMLRTQTVDQEAGDRGRMSKISFGVSVTVSILLMTKDQPGGSIRLDIVGLPEDE